MLGDLKSHRWIITKGILFLLTGLLACGLILVEHPTIRNAVLLAIAVWCFARFYYFAFYVLEHYVDSNYRYAGLLSALRFAVSRWRQPSVEQPRRDHD